MKNRYMGKNFFLTGPRNGTSLINRRGKKAEEYDNRA